MLTKVRTAMALGLPSIARVVWYKLGLRLGFNPVRNLRAATPAGRFFRAATAPPVAAPLPELWQQSASLFGRWPLLLTSRPPDWLANPLTGTPFPAPQRPWWLIPDVDAAAGDIKLIWELSRMDWVVALAQHARNGDADALERLNVWLADWCEKNSPYIGPNWKCGQEASIRVLHLAVAALILGQVKGPEPALRDLVALHLKRIVPTLQYAMGQDNNHGTSEAAALYVGGHWLALLGFAEGARWQAIGQHWLENRSRRLIGLQGSFSQYSVNYHRVLLDTISIVELWRRDQSLPPFSPLWWARAEAATVWLRHMVEPLTGDAPNLGANDGARLLQLTNTGYRDFRPSVQLGMTLFIGKAAYPEGPWNDALRWLGLALPPVMAPRPGSLLADDGGFAVLRRGPALAVLRYPRFRFRPSQADALHLDLWLDGVNLLRDAGTYSYNTAPSWLNYFGGTASHNTIEFDGRDQMPRLGRFLFGDWLKTSFLGALEEAAGAIQFGAGYRDAWRAGHRRHVGLGDSEVVVVDSIDGFAQRAVLRWRLAPGDWRLDGQTVSNGAHVLSVQASMPIVRCELIEGWESRHYGEKTPLPVLEIEVHQPGMLTSSYGWAS